MFCLRKSHLLVSRNFHEYAYELANHDLNRLKPFSLHTSYSSFLLYNVNEQRQ